MKPNNVYILLLSIIISFTFSCSSNKKDQDQGISVFQTSNSVEVDKSLEEVVVRIPRMKKNHSWFGQNSDNNNGIGNFSFANKITESKSIWSGYRSGDYKQMVFAPIVAQDKIFLIDAKGNVTARDLETYKKIWKKKITEKSNRKNYANGKISYDNNKIFASTGYNHLVALDSRDGSQIWSRKIGSIPISTPVSDGDTVFVITNDNKTYAFNANDGEIVWVHSGILRNTGIIGAANPVFYKDYVVVSYSSGEIYVLNKKTGESGWVHDLNVNKATSSDFVLNDIDATPVIKNGVVYAIGNGGLMMAISIKDGNILWQKELSSISDFWVAGRFIYLVNNDNQLICIYSENGKVKWLRQLKKYQNKKKPSTKIIYNGIIMAGNSLILSNSNREILLISPGNGNIIQTKKTNQMIYHTPIIVNEKLYLHTLGRFSVDLKVMK